MGSNPTPSARTAVSRFQVLGSRLAGWRRGRHDAGKIERFEDIEAWREARLLVSSIYNLARGPRLAADKSLRDQLQRAAVSVMANIAEGFERGSNRQFIQYLLQARGSAGEVRSLLYVAHDLHLIGEEEFQNAMERATLVARLLSGFVRYLRQSAT